MWFLLYSQPYLHTSFYLFESSLITSKVLFTSVSQILNIHNVNYNEIGELALAFKVDSPKKFIIGIAIAQINWHFIMIK